MSPETAAQVAGTTRWTIMRAIKAQRLRATRDNRNQWRITPEDLDVWRRAHLAHSALTVRKDDPAHPAQEVAQGTAHPDEALQAEVEAFRREVERLERDLLNERARAEALEREVATERARADAEAKRADSEAKRADREGAAADDLRIRLTSAAKELDEERHALRTVVERIMAPAPEPAPSPVRRRGFLARLLGT